MWSMLDDIFLDLVLFARACIVDRYILFVYLFLKLCYFFAKARRRGMRMDFR